MTSIGTIISHFLMAVMGVAQFLVILLAVLLLVYLLRIARWYIKEQDVPPLFGRRNKKYSEE